MGRFLNGQVVGHFWIGLIKTGFLHGVANKDGLATGNNLAFIYPDGETALKGYFENKYMKSAKYVEVQKYCCDENGMLGALVIISDLVISNISLILLLMMIL